MLKISIFCHRLLADSVCLCVRVCMCVSRAGRWSNRGGVNLLLGKSLLLLLSSFCLSFFKYFIMLCWSAPSVLPLLFSSHPPSCSLLAPLFSHYLCFLYSVCSLCWLFLHLESTTPSLSWAWGSAHIIMPQQACGGSPCGNRKSQQRRDY